MRLIRKYPHFILTTVCIILMPLFLGILKGTGIEGSVPVHFGIRNASEAFTTRGNAVFLIPGILLVIHILCIALAFGDPRPDDISETLFRLRLWIAPVFSLLVIGALYAYTSDGILIGSRVLALFGCFLLTLFSAHVPEKVKALDDNVWNRYRGMLKAAFSLLAVLVLLGYFL